MHVEEEEEEEEKEEEEKEDLVPGTPPSKKVSFSICPCNGPHCFENTFQ